MVAKLVDESTCIHFDPFHGSELRPYEPKKPNRAIREIIIIHLQQSLSL